MQCGPAGRNSPAVDPGGSSHHPDPRDNAHYDQSDRPGNQPNLFPFDAEPKQHQAKDDAEYEGKDEHVLGATAGKGAVWRLAFAVSHRAMLAHPPKSGSGSLVAHAISATVFRAVKGLVTSSQQIGDVVFGGHLGNAYGDRDFHRQAADVQWVPCDLSPKPLRQI